LRGGLFFGLLHVCLVDREVILRADAMFLRQSPAGFTIAHFMARLPRLYAPSIAQHVAQRVADGRIAFIDDEDYLLFTGLLSEAVSSHGVALHAYVLLPSQIRLLATPPDAGAIGRVMQFIGRRYVPHLNRRTGRSGALWERRYRSTLIDPDVHLLEAMRYIERQPVAEGLATGPEQWRWSSHGHHVGREQQPFVNDHFRYWSLSDTPFERQANYRALVDLPLDPAALGRIERAVDRGWALGDANFLSTLAGELNRRAGPLRRGRPRSRIVMSPKKP